MKNYTIPAICTIVLVLFLIWFYTRNPLTTTIYVGNTKFYVDVAATGEEKQRGLGYRNDLPQDHGMLFVYDHAERYSFWMKDMRFPIDIIWIKDTEIVDISKNVPVSINGALPNYSPRIPANKVLEINAGLSDKHSIHIGDTISISN